MRAGILPLNQNGEMKTYYCQFTNFSAQAPRPAETRQDPTRWDPPRQDGKMKTGYCHFTNFSPQGTPEPKSQKEKLDTEKIEPTTSTYAPAVPRY